MAGQSIAPHDSKTGIPTTRRMAYDSAATFKSGALLLLASDGELAECGADPTLVFAVAADPAGEGPGFKMANDPLVITGRDYACSVWPIEHSQVWICRGVNGGTDPVTPTQTMVGEQYGALADADGIWTLDIAETTAKVFSIVDVDIERKLFFVRFIDAVIQPANP